MMDDLAIFRFEGSDVRMLSINGEPWVVAGDVCDFFEVTNRNRVMQEVDPEDKGGTQMDTPGGRQTVTIINESGLYALLFALQPQKARGVAQSVIDARVERVRKFKRWVTHEVLPSIRKTGSYDAAAPRELTRLEILELAMESERRALAEAERADAAEETVAAFQSNKGLPVRSFLKKHFPDVRESDIWRFIYFTKKLLAHDPEGRWSEVQQKRIPGPTHMHPYAKGKEFFELSEDLDRDKKVRFNTRVRRDRELDFVAYLERHGFRSNRVESGRLFEMEAV